MSYALLSVQGANRPGIVAEIAQLLHRHRVNIADSSMTTLRSEFVMMLLLEMPEGLDLATLSADFPALETHRLHLHLQPLGDDEMATPSRPLRPSHAISVIGPDQTGIVYRVSSVLAEQGVNILDVDTQLLERPGQPLYAMLLEIDVGDGDPDALKAALKATASDLGVDLNIHPVEYAEI